MDVDGKGDFVLSPEDILVIKKNLNHGCVQHLQWVHIEFLFPLMYSSISSWDVLPGLRPTLPTALSFLFFFLQLTFSTKT